MKVDASEEEVAPRTSYTEKGRSGSLVQLTAVPAQSKVASQASEVQVSPGVVMVPVGV